MKSVRTESGILVRVGIFHCHHPCPREYLSVNEPSEFLIALLDEGLEPFEAPRFLLDVPISECSECDVQRVEIRGGRPVDLGAEPGFDSSVDRRSHRAMWRPLVHPRLPLLRQLRESGTDEPCPDGAWRKSRDGPDHRIR